MYLSGHQSQLDPKSKIQSPNNNHTVNICKHIAIPAKMASNSGAEDGTEILTRGVETLNVNPTGFVKPVQEPTSTDECKQRLEKFIRTKGLEKFYEKVSPELAEKAQNMVNELREQQQCTREMANQFALLTLYDFAILIGMNPQIDSGIKSRFLTLWEQMTPTPWYTIKRVPV